MSLQRCCRWNTVLLETSCWQDEYVMAEMSPVECAHPGTSCWDEVVMLTCAMDTPSSVCVPNGPTMRPTRSWKIFFSFRIHNKQYGHAELSLCSVCVPNGPPLEFYHRDVIDGMRSSKKFPVRTKRRAMPFERRHQPLEISA